MIYPDTPVEAWKKRYRLNEEEYICPKCGGTFFTSRPFITNSYAGLETPRHSCGDKYVKAVFKPIKKSEIEFWGSI